MGERGSASTLQRMPLPDLIQICQHFIAQRTTLSLTTAIAMIDTQKADKSHGHHHHHYRHHHQTPHHHHHHHQQGHHHVDHFWRRMQTSAVAGGASVHLRFLLHCCKITISKSEKYSCKITISKSEKYSCKIIISKCEKYSAAK